MKTLPSSRDGVTVIPNMLFSLLGPSEKFDEARWPVRGDLAHIAFAGRCFVPHYAVPMPHRVNTTGVKLHKTAHGESDVLAQIAAGSRFDVLDIIGDWCWGQISAHDSHNISPDDSGLVGYVARNTLDAESDL